MVRIRLLGGVSVEIDGRPASGAAAQPRRLALLAVVACAGDAGVRRERLLALFWPDADEERGRAALKQAVYALRRDLGAESVIGGQQVLQLAPTRATSDVAEFRAAIAAGRLEQAAALYGGPLLDSFRLPGADVFDRWLDDERRALAHGYAESLDRLAADATRRGDAATAVRWWGALAAHDPMSAHAAVGLMEALAAAGDVGAALRHARVHAALLAHELELPPDARVAAVETRLRAAKAIHSTATTTTPPPTTPPTNAPTASAAGGVAAERVARRPMTRHRRVLAVLGIALATTTAAGARVLLHSADSGASPVLAVGRVTTYRGDSAASASAEPLADMLATNLARTPGLRVISPARMYALLGDRQSADSPAAVANAARRAGATELLEGTLNAAGGTLRLDLRRVELASGRIVAAGSVTGHDPFTLVDSGTARLVGSYGRTESVGPVADVTTRSEVAYRLYAEAVRRGFHDGDWAGARRLFAAASGEDTTFAMAAWWNALLTPVPEAERARLLVRVDQLAEHASERERLVIRASLAQAMSSPSLRAYAESLLTRYPDEVDGHLYMGLALRFADEYAAALPHLERAVAMDSGHANGVGHPECRACEALRGVADTYLLMDSLALAARTERRWITLDSTSARAWRHLTLVLEAAGRGDEATAAWRRAAVLDPPSVADERQFLMSHSLQYRDYARADAVIQEAMQTGSADELSDALWWRALELRQLGRLDDAMRAAHRLRAIAWTTAPTPGAALPTALMEAQLLMDAGQLHASAALFDSVGRDRRAYGKPSEYARNRSWMLAHAADALALAGDTAALARLVDSVAYWGARSLLGRDQRMHHHVRGLLLAARGDDAGAVAELRAAMRSLNLGYSRTNFALAQALLRLHRPLEAVRVLQPAFHGPIDNANAYLSRTELHALLARAWAAAGNADSAAAHRRIVAEDWAHADAAYLSRAGEVLGARSWRGGSDAAVLMRRF